jgi:phage-related holin
MIPRGLFFVIAGLLAISWAISFFYWNAHNIVHILIVLAAISLIFGLVKRNGVE